jgi:hypothetical protein
VLLSDLNQLTTPKKALQALQTLQTLQTPKNTPKNQNPPIDSSSTENANTNTNTHFPISNLQTSLSILHKHNPHLPSFETLLPHIETPHKFLFPLPGMMPHIAAFDSNIGISTHNYFMKAIELCLPNDRGNVVQNMSQNSYKKLLDYINIWLPYNIMSLRQIQKTGLVLGKEGSEIDHFLKMFSSSQQNVNNLPDKNKTGEQRPPHEAAIISAELVEKMDETRLMGVNLGELSSSTLLDLLSPVFTQNNGTNAEINNNVDNFYNGNDLFILLNQFLRNWNREAKNNHSTRSHVFNEDSDYNVLPLGIIQEALAQRGIDIGSDLALFSYFNKNSLIHASNHLVFQPHLSYQMPSNRDLHRGLRGIGGGDQHGFQGENGEFDLYNPLQPLKPSKYNLDMYIFNPKQAMSIIKKQLLLKNVLDNNNNHHKNNNFSQNEQSLLNDFFSRVSNISVLKSDINALPKFPLSTYIPLSDPENQLCYEEHQRMIQMMQFLSDKNVSLDSLFGQSKHSRLFFQNTGKRTKDLVSNHFLASKMFSNNRTDLKNVVLISDHNDIINAMGKIIPLLVKIKPNVSPFEIISSIPRLFDDEIVGEIDLGNSDHKNDQNDFNNKNGETNPNNDLFNLERDSPRYNQASKLFKFHQNVISDINKYLGNWDGSKFDHNEDKYDDKYDDKNQNPNRTKKIKRPSPPPLQASGFLHLDNKDVLNWMKGLKFLERSPHPKMVTKLSPPFDPFDRSDPFDQNDETNRNNLIVFRNVVEILKKHFSEADLEPKEIGHNSEFGGNNINNFGEKIQKSSKNTHNDVNMALLSELHPVTCVVDVIHQDNVFDKVFRKDRIHGVDLFEQQMGITMKSNQNVVVPDQSIDHNDNIGEKTSPLLTLHLSSTKPSKNNPNNESLTLLIDLDSPNILSGADDFSDNSGRFADDFSSKKSPKKSPKKSQKSPNQLGQNSSLPTLHPHLDVLLSTIFSSEQILKIAAPSINGKGISLVQQLRKKFPHNKSFNFVENLVSPTTFSQNIIMYQDFFNQDEQDERYVMDRDAHLEKIGVVGETGVLEMNANNEKSVQNEDKIAANNSTKILLDYRFNKSRTSQLSQYLTEFTQHATGFIEPHIGLRNGQNGQTNQTNQTNQGNQHDSNDPNDPNENNGMSKHIILGQKNHQNYRINLPSYFFQKDDDNAINHEKLFEMSISSLTRQYNTDTSLLHPKTKLIQNYHQKYDQNDHQNAQNSTTPTIHLNIPPQTYPTVDPALTSFLQHSEPPHITLPNEYMQTLHQKLKISPPNNQDAQNAQGVPKLDVFSHPSNQPLAFKPHPYPIHRSIIQRFLQSTYRVDTDNTLFQLRTPYEYDTTSQNNPPKTNFPTRLTTINPHNSLSIPSIHYQFQTPCSVRTYTGSLSGGDVGGSKGVELWASAPHTVGNWKQPLRLAQLLLLHEQKNEAIGAVFNGIRYGNIKGNRTVSLGAEQNQPMHLFKNNNSSTINVASMLLAVRESNRNTLRRYNEIHRRNKKSYDMNVDIQAGITNSLNDKITAKLKDANGVLPVSDKRKENNHKTKNNFRYSKRAKNLPHQPKSHFSATNHSLR